MNASDTNASVFQNPFPPQSHNEPRSDTQLEAHFQRLLQFLQSQPRSQTNQRSATHIQLPEVPPSVIPANRDVEANIDETNPSNDHERPNLADEPVAPTEPEQELSSIFSDTPELQWLGVLLTSKTFIPFVLIMCMLFLYEHSHGLLLCLWLFLLLYKSNSTIKAMRQIQSTSDVISIGIVMLALVANVICILFLYKDRELYRSFLLLVAKDIKSVWDVLWLCMVNDSLVIHFTMLAKCVLLLLFARRSPFTVLGQSCTFVELLSTLMRTILPISVWYNFLTNSTLFPLLLCSLCSMLYVFSKTTQLILAGLDAVETLMHLRHKPMWSTASPSSLEQGTLSCPICQENMKEIVTLPCKHTFCEACISEWVEQKPTCPICRRSVLKEKRRGLTPYSRNISTNVAFNIF